MPAERTPDGHHVVVDGRRWRAADTGLPDDLRQELVSELMAARRAVRAADDDRDERAARDRVQDAKLALGERGPVWWEPVTTAEVDGRHRATTRALARARDVDESDARLAADADRAVDHLDVDD